MISYTALGWIIFLLAAPLPAAEPDLSAAIRSHMPAPAGLAVVLGDGPLARALSTQPGWNVLMLEANPVEVDKARNQAAQAGTLNRTLYVDCPQQGKLLLADHYADAVILDLSTTGVANVTAPEALRVLSPGGRLLVRGERSAVEKFLSIAAKPDYFEDGGRIWGSCSKPLPAGTDDWSHWFHGGDNNPVSTDTVFRWPPLVQWTGLPYRSPQPTIALVANGIVFTLLGSSYGSLVDQHNLSPYELTLTARNAWSGMIYWTRPIKEYQPVGRGGYVATAQVFYLLDDDAVLALDPRTGKELSRFVGQGCAGQEAKWLARDGSALFVLYGPPDRVYKRAATGKAGVENKYPIPPEKLVLPEADKAENTKNVVQEESPSAGPETLQAAGKGSKVSYTRSWGLGRTLVCLDATTGATRWTHQSPADIDARCCAVRDGRLTYAAQNARIAALEEATGKELWVVTDSALLAKLQDPGGLGHAALGLLQPALMVGPEAAALQLKGRNHLLVFAIDTGKLLLDLATGGKRLGLFYDGRLTVDQYGPVNDQWDLPKRGGGAKGGFSWSVSGCGPTTVTPTAYCGRHGIEWDRVTSQPISDAAYRSGCWQDSFIANGLLWNTPYTCGCSYLTRGYNVLAPRGSLDISARADSERTERGRAGAASSTAATPADWTTGRADIRRSGSVSANVPASVKLRWTAKGGSRPTAPSAVGESVYVADDSGLVRCLALADGVERWAYATGGRIVQAPTWAQGRVYVGSSDGWAYCLDAATGALVWRFRGAPQERRIYLYGHLSSTWPCLSGVLVQDGVAYCAFGFIDRDGTWVYALDAGTGAVRWQNGDSGHAVDPGSRKGASVSGTLTIAGPALWLAAGNKVCPVGYDLQTGATILPPYVSKDAYDPIRRGRDIGALSDEFLIHGGVPLHSEQAEWSEGGARNDWAFCKLVGGKPSFPELALVINQHPPAWGHGVLLTESIGKKERRLEAWDLARTMTYLQADYPAGETQDAKKKGLALRGIEKKAPLDDVPMINWKITLPYCNGLALAQNAALALVGKSLARNPHWGDQFSLNAWGLLDGKPLWEVALPAEPVFDALCLARDGTVIVSLLSGEVVAVGK